MNKKSGVILIIIILAVLGLLSLKNRPMENTESQPISDKKDQNFLLEGFPIDKVPLFKLNEISSNKIFINIDPKNVSDFEETNFAYFNVVFYTDASQEEFLNYYKNLFESEIVEGFKPDDMVKGKVGEYQVSAAHYGSNNTAYIQVHLPDFQSEALSQYFVDFPEILTTNSTLVEHEKSYGLLNQKGGEVEYTKYFTVIDSGDEDNDGKDDVDEFLVLEEEYQQQFQNKPEFSYDQKSGTMKWRDGDFESTLVISRDHGRIYLMLRKPLIN
jgi:hypothetical protein